MSSLIESLSLEATDEARRERVASIFSDKYQDDAWCSLFQQQLIILGDEVKQQAAELAESSANDAATVDDATPTQDSEAPQTKSPQETQLWAMVDMMIQSKTIVKRAREADQKQALEQQFAKGAKPLEEAKSTDEQQEQQQPEATTTSQNESINENSENSPSLLTSSSSSSSWWAPFQESMQTRWRIVRQSQTEGNSVTQILADVLAGEYDAKATQVTIDKEIQSAPVVMFSWKTSPSCVKVVEAFALMGISSQIKIVPLDEPWDEGNILRAELGKRVGRTSVPMIFIGGRYVGGFDGGTDEEAPGIQAMSFQGRLRPALEEAGIVFSE